MENASNSARWEWLWREKGRSESRSEKDDDIGSFEAFVVSCRGMGTGTVDAVGVDGSRPAKYLGSRSSSGAGGVGWSARMNSFSRS